MGFEPSVPSTMEEKTSSDAPATESHYDAVWFLGYDSVSERYVLHLMDTFGGRFSETIGYGNRAGNQLRAYLNILDGTFKNTYSWNSDNTSLGVDDVEQKDKIGA